MADYGITGKKGAGKTLFAVGVIRDALAAGKRVATNLDVYLDHLLPPRSKATLIRLPDRPTVHDLEAIGKGQEGKVEDDNGIIVLDETALSFNSRTFGDKERQPLLDWLVHSRKKGWDVYYIMQGLGQIDKQIRDTQIEYHVAVKRTDKWPIPGVTPLAKMLGLTVRFPKMHFGIIKHGVDRDSLVVDRKFYRGTDFYTAYDTQQLFLDRGHPDAVGLHTVLSAWHLKGRHMPKIDLYKGAIVFAAVAGLTMGAAIGAAAHKFSAGVETTTAKTEKPSDSVFVNGVIRDERGFRILLSDGRLGSPSQIKEDPEGFLYNYDKQWYRTKK